MGDEGDFDWVKGKVAKRDKSGNEIARGSLGSGGTRREDGTLSAMAYDLEYLSGGDSSSAEGRGLSPEMQMWMLKIGAIVFKEVVVPAGKAAAPHVQAWLIESAVPSAKDKLRRIATRRSATAQANDQGGGSAPAGLLEGELVEASKAVDPAVEEPRISMSSAEWQEVFRAWISVAALEEALRRVLANAHVEDDDDVLIQVRSAMEKLTPENRALVANQVLELNPALLEEETLMEFVKLFGEGELVHGQSVPAGLLRPKEDGA